MMTLKGKRALVTGGGSGIGRAISCDLAAAGVELTVCGRRAAPVEETVRLIEAGGGRARARIADLTDPESTEELAAAMLNEGGVDILVHNAGANSRVRSARYIGADEWSQVMDVNTLGPAVLTRALLPPMIGRGDGHVVLIASMAAIRPGVVAGVAYSAAKAAARAYMEVLFSEVRRYGIRCTTVLPGEVDTPILDDRALPPDDAARALMMRPEDIAATIRMALTLPQRANVTEIAVTALTPRDMSADLKAALGKQRPDQEHR